MHTFLKMFIFTCFTFMCFNDFFKSKNYESFWVSLAWSLFFLNVTIDYIKKFINEDIKDK